jgi:hypothetical protein
VIDHQVFIENPNKKSDLHFKKEIELINKKSIEIVGYARDHSSNLNYHSHYYQGQIKPKINEILLYKFRDQIVTNKSHEILDLEKSFKNTV